MAALVALDDPATAGLPSGPTFPAGVVADGQAWTTSVTAPVADPADPDAFDPLYVVTGGDNPAGQPPVAAAGPANPAYNGGRWATHTARWTDAGRAAHGTVPVLTRLGPADDPASILYHERRGHLETTRGSPAGGPPPHVRCPLLPAGSWATPQAGYAGRLADECAVQTPTGHPGLPVEE